MILAVFLVAAASLLTGFALFDMILQDQYQNHRKVLEKEGGTTGFFWMPPDSSWLSGSLQRAVRVLSWRFRTEDWMRNRPSILRTALIMRICFFTFLGMLLSLVVLSTRLST